MTNIEKLRFSTPNILSLLRIPLSLLIIPFAENKVLLFVLFIAAALTDFFDGFIARKYKMESRLGAYLDSIADFVFFSVIVFYCFKYQGRIIDDNSLLLILILSVRILSLLVCLKRNKKIYMLHTIGNKISGLMIFLFIVVNIFIPLYPYAIYLLLFVLLSAVEELAIMIFIKSPNINYKGMLFSNRI